MTTSSYSGPDFEPIETEAGRYFAEHHHHTHRFNHSVKRWMVRRNGKWVRDDRQEAQECMNKLVRSRLEDPTLTDQDRSRIGRYRFAKNALSVAQALRSCAKTAKDFEVDDE